MGKVLEFKRKPSTTRASSTQPNLANSPKEIDPTEIAKGIRSAFTDEELELIRRQLQEQIDDEESDN